MITVSNAISTMDRDPLMSDFQRGILKELQHGLCQAREVHGQPKPYHPADRKLPGAQYSARVERVPQQVHHGAHDCHCHHERYGDIEQVHGLESGQDGAPDRENYQDRDWEDLAIQSAQSRFQPGVPCCVDFRETQAQQSRALPRNQQCLGDYDDLPQDLSALQVVEQPRDQVAEFIVVVLHGFFRPSYGVDPASNGTECARCRSQFSM